MDSEKPERNSNATNAAVEFDGVTRRYATTTAVDDVTLAVREGEFFTLVGPSGCGKTTILRLLAGFEEPTAGAVHIADGSMAGVPPEDRGIGVVFQSYALFPHLTVGENVGYGLNFATPPGGVSDAERVESLLDLVDLDGMADRDPDELSGGQQQRVAIARALAPGPHLLLLDEPMSALDAKLREQLRVQVKAIQEELGIATVYVTHDQEEALAVSDRVAVMNDGGVEQVGTPREIYRRPETRFVAEFVGDNNVFEGEVQHVEDGVIALAVGDSEFEVARDAADIEAGDRAVVCVRPENLTVGGGPNAISATVESTEFLGETSRVRLDWDGRPLVVRTADPLNGTVEVGFDPEGAHLVEML